MMRRLKKTLNKSRRQACALITGDCLSACMQVCLCGPYVFICSLNLPCFSSATLFYSTLTDSLCSALPVVSSPFPPACPPPSGSLALVYLLSLKAALLPPPPPRHLVSLANFFSTPPGWIFFSLSFNSLTQYLSFFELLPAALSSQSSFLLFLTISPLLLLLYILNPLLPYALKPRLLITTSHPLVDICISPPPPSIFSPFLLFSPLLPPSSCFSYNYSPSFHLPPH